MLTDAEMLELETLLKERDIDISRKRLKVIDEDTNPNYKLLQQSILEQSYNEIGELSGGYRGAALEGSSRSGKTWSGVDIIIWICLYVEESCTINIYRQTYNEFKTTLYDDFKRRLDYFGLPNPFHNAKEVKSFRIGKSTIYFLGDGKHGGGCDYAFFNEMMFIQHPVFDQTEMRCRKFWWADYNPSVTDHWFFDKVLTRPDVAFLRTTYLDNKFISVQEKNKILSYEPWKPGSYIIKDSIINCYNKATGKVEPVTDSNQPTPHPTNITNGTADEFMWKVYGLGLRGAMKGVIFPHVTWIDTFPEDKAIIYPNDFGFTTDPNVLGKYAEDEFNIWFEPLSYKPIENATDLSAFMEACEIPKEAIIPCDSADKYTGENKGTVEMVRDLKRQGYINAFKISKTKSIMYWLNSMKTKKIHIVKNHLYAQALKEQQNYRMKEINGISINQPGDSYNHIWDACFEGNTLITTNIGLIPIKSVKEGDFVLTSKGLNKVLNKWNNGIKEIYSFRIKLDTFSLTLHCTKNHKVKTDKGWIEISKLEKGMTVYITNHLMEKNINCTKEKYTSLEIIKKCIGLFGNTLTVKGKKDFIYIIRMRIHSIIIFQILRKLAQANITRFTLKKGLKKIQSGLNIFAKKGLKHQKNGTHQKKVEFGIQKTQRSMDLEILNMDFQTVNNVELNSKKKILNTHFAQIIANQKTEDYRELTTKLDNVNFAQKSLFAINTQKQNVVQKFVVEKIDSNKIGFERVYDLHIENEHEYFANGMLVHNCRYGHIAHNSKTTVLATSQEVLNTINY